MQKVPTKFQMGIKSGKSYKKQEKDAKVLKSRKKMQKFQNIGKKMQKFQNIGKKDAKAKKVLKKVQKMLKVLIKETKLQSMLNSDQNWVSYPSLKFEKVVKVCASGKEGKKLDCFVYKEKISRFIKCVSWKKTGEKKNMRENEKNKNED